MRKATVPFLSVVLILLTCHFIFAAETIKFNVIKDVWLSSYPGEENRNMGRTSRLKLKGIQEMALIDFDLSRLSGKKIEDARLYLKNASGKNKLRKIGLSTVGSPWVEGNSHGVIPDFLGRGATFFYASYKKITWAGDHSDLTDVTMGNGHTWQHHSVLQKENDGWWSVDVDPILIQAMIAKKSYGLLLMDESGQTFANNYVFSKESGKDAPYLVLSTSRSQKNRPKALDATLSPFPTHAHMAHGAVVLRLELEESLFAFDLSVNGELVPLWRIPKPGPINTNQEIVLDWLDPEKDVQVKIVAVDELGQRSEASSLRTFSSKALSKIPLPSLTQKQVRPLLEPRSKISLKPHIWALPEITKIDPISGYVLSEKVVREFDHKNIVWSGEDQTIHLMAMRGEVVGFQLLIPAQMISRQPFQIVASELVGGTGSSIRAQAFSFFKAHYLKTKGVWHPEFAVPMVDGKLPLDIGTEKIVGQKNHIITVDLAIPSESVSSIYHGQILIKNDGEEVSVISISVKVIAKTLPRSLNFVPELNMYHGPDKTGTTVFFEAHRLANQHRVVLNRVPYGQDGRVHQDMIPEISFLEGGDFEIDWEDYDRRIGPLLDGTAFVSGVRRGVPVEKFYIPFFENWPLVLAPHYRYKANALKTRKSITEHAMEAKSLSEIISPEYKKTFVRLLQAFMLHFEEKGWNQTEFQFYLNNKWHWKNASSWWNLDEPMHYDDWMAIKFFGDLFQEAKGSTTSSVIFRADISRPRWQRNWLDDQLDRMYVASALFEHPERVRLMKKNGHIFYSLYGSLNNIADSNQKTVFWCMRAFIEGADGVLPWQSLGKKTALDIPDKNALLFNLKGQDGLGWIFSLRVKALRRCQQNVEMMVMIEKEQDYNREQMRRFFYDYFEGKEGESERPVRTDQMEGFRRILFQLLEGS